MAPRRRQRRWTGAVGAAALAWAAASAPASGELYELTYEGRAYGVLGLGQARIELDISTDAYRISADLRSGGLLALFERTTLTAAAVGAIEAGAPRWRAYVLDHAYSRKRRQITMRPTPDGVLADIQPTYRLWGDPPATDAQKRASRDPLSSWVAMGVHVGRTGDCAGDFPTFDGRFHYILRLSGGRADDLRADGYDGAVTRCVLQYVPVAGFEADDGGGEGRIPTGEMWFAEPDALGFAAPVRVTAPLPLGSVGIYLQRFRRASVAIGQPEAPSPPPP